MFSNKVVLVFFTICAIAHVTYSQEDSGVEQRSLLPITITKCNYTAQPGASCANCQQVLLCKPNNMGILKKCNFLIFPKFCNNGHCSFSQSDECAATTTSATTVVATTTTETATTTQEATTGGN